MDQAAHKVEQDRIQQELIGALEASQTRPLNKDEVSLLAWACGVQLKGKS